MKIDKITGILIGAGVLVFGGSAYAVYHYVFKPKMDEKRRAKALAELNIFEKGGEQAQLDILAKYKSKYPAKRYTALKDYILGKQWYAKGETFTGYYNSADDVLIIEFNKSAFPTQKFLSVIKSDFKEN